MVTYEYKMLTKDEALQHCNEILGAFCKELSIPTPIIQNSDLWGTGSIGESTYNGYRISFRPFYRHSGTAKDFLWDINCPNWKLTWHNEVEISYKFDEVLHPECPCCEESLAIVRTVKTKEDAQTFAKQIKE